MPKRSVLDPQGKAVKHALESMNFTGIKDVRVGKFMDSSARWTALPWGSSTFLFGMIMMRAFITRISRIRHELHEGQ